MEQALDYSSYSNDELRDCLANIDRNKYPERTLLIETELNKENRNTVEVKQAEKEKAENSEVELINLILPIVLLFFGMFILSSTYFDWQDGVATGRHSTLLRSENWEKFDLLIGVRILLGFGFLSGAAYTFFNKKKLPQNENFSLGKEVEHKPIDHSQRLTKIFKVLLPSLILISIIFFQYYRYSIDTIEIYVVSKDSEWVEHCTESGCVEFPIFTIKSRAESFKTSEDLFNQFEPNNSYLVGTKGWNLFGTNRKLTQIY
jgi:hypothetical protein